MSLFQMGRNCVLQSVWCDAVPCFGSGRKTILITWVCKVAAKQCCVEPRSLTVKGPRSWGNGIRTADLIWLRGHSIPYGIKGKEFCRGWEFICLSSVARRIAGHRLGSGKQFHMHHLQYTYICVFVIIITLFLFPILLNTLLIKTLGRKQLCPS